MLFGCKQVWLGFLDDFVVFNKALVLVWHCNGLSDLNEVVLGDRWTFLGEGVVVPREFISGAVDDREGWCY